MAPARLLCAIACLIASVLVHAPVALADDSAEAVIEADRVLTEFFEASGAPGLAVSVGRDGALLWSRGHGFADLEQQVPVDPARTRFRIGSVAKPITALALVQLVEQGKIQLDQNVRTYVPRFPPKAHDFSVRQLAGHLAGIRHYREGESYLRKRFGSVEAGLTLFQDDPLIGAPGEQWRYSSHGYNLLSAVIEQAAERAFPDVLVSSVFAPLDMQATVVDELAEIIPQRGRYYLRRDGRNYNEPEVDNSYKWASGGLLSTTEDMLRFGLAHFDDSKVTPAMRELLWTEQHTNAGEPTGYGIGWRIVVDGEGHRWIGHGGGSIGGTSQLWLFPDDGLVIACASNLTELNYADLLPRLRAVFVAPAQRTEPNATGAHP